MEKLNCQACDEPYEEGQRSCTRCGCPLPRRKRRVPDPGEAESPPEPAIETDGDPFAAPIVILVGTTDGRRIPVHVGDRLVIGRNSESPLSSLCSDNISSFHAEIYIEDGAAYVLDTDSTNGTFVDGRRIAPNKRWELPPVGSVRLGSDPPLELTVEIDHG